MNEHIDRIIADIIGPKPSENTEGVWSLAVLESKAEKIRTALTSAYNMGLEKAKEVAKDIEEERWRTAFVDKPKLGAPLHEFLLRIEKEKI